MATARYDVLLVQELGARLVVLWDTGPITAANTTDAARTARDHAPEAISAWCDANRNGCWLLASARASAEAAPRSAHG